MKKSPIALGAFALVLTGCSATAEAVPEVPLVERMEVMLEATHAIYEESELIHDAYTDAGLWGQMAADLTKFCEDDSVVPPYGYFAVVGESSPAVEKTAEAAYEALCVE